jgi:hypothetical protein
MSNLVSYDVRGSEHGDEHKNRRDLVVVQTWDALLVPPGEPVRSWQLDGIFDEVVAGIAVPGVATQAQCAAATEAFHARGAELKKYAGTANNLTEGLGRSHWPARYPGGNTGESWHTYHDSVEASDEERRLLLGPIFGCDPLDMLVGMLEATYVEGDVRRATHPRFGRRMGAGLLRCGVPRPHSDNASVDLPYEITGHMGVVLVLNAAPGAVQRVHRTTLTAPIERGAQAGNYDLSVPPGTEFIDIPSTAGFVNFLSARFVHEVIDDAERLTLAIHVVRKKNGDLVYFA